MTEVTFDEINIPTGGRVLLVDGLHPEDLAMLQALYSRSAESATVHLAKVRETGSGKFMSRYYVGYGHKSIADCASTTLFFEHVSILAAKAIQDNPLYSGQETSTRYLDMGTRRIVDPISSKTTAAIHERLMEFYTTGMAPTRAEVHRRFPRRIGEDTAAYERAVGARTFDILRGFLPAGMTTQLSWHTNLRQAGDHLTRMSEHPLQEVRQLVGVARAALANRFNSSGFDTSNDSTAVMQWEHEFAGDFAYPQLPIYAVLSDGTVSLCGRFAGRPGAWEALKTRPRGARLPHFLADLGQLTCTFLLDYGAWRDIQRHRNGVCRSALLTTRHGFHPWYLEQLDTATRAEAEAMIVLMTHQINALDASTTDRQYYIPLGFRVECQVTYGLPALIYVLELRSGKAVHPTLRRVIHQIAKRFQQDYPEVALHIDADPDDWDVRRGTQTITERA
jgi:thymidylate synthase ThyX